MTSWFEVVRASVLGLVMLAPLGPGGAWASSLPPASARAVAGPWRLVLDGQRQPCVLHLAPDGAAASDPPGCEAGVLRRQGMARWLSKPDGLALINGEGRTLLFLNPVPGGRYLGYSRHEQPVTLEPLTP